MARKKSFTLTDAELRLMEVIWQKNSASAAEVLEALPDAEIAYTTVLNTLRILETKGYVRHSKEGKAFIYHPLVNRDQASSTAVQQLMTRFFRNSPGLLVSNLIQNEQLNKRELRQLKKLIDESE